ncbi:MAG: endonuclease/exonuclease/phosphatase family protein [Micromonosporaceae bacterium]
MGSTTEPAPQPLRIATLNVYGRHADWPGRRDVLAAGLRRTAPQLVAFQEVIADGRYDQVADILGDGYHVAHHSRRQPDGLGISVASRWPFQWVHEIPMPVTPRSGDFGYSALAAELVSPFGSLVLVNHFPDWQRGHEYEREQQTVAAAGFVERLVGVRPAHVVLAGDLDATPDAATIRFWTGRQSLGGLSVCYRDTWSAVRGPEPGHTFTRENPLVSDEWTDETGRRIDYLLVRCDDHGPTLRIAAAYRIFDKPEDGIQGSDHYGVCTELAPW